MTTEERQIIKDMFDKLKAVYYHSKVNDDLIQKILAKLPTDTVPVQTHARIEATDAKLTEAELKSLQERIDKL